MARPQSADTSPAARSANLTDDNNNPTGYRIWTFGGAIEGQILYC